MTGLDPLAGRTAFISGGSRGIGLEIARMLARAGANIALIAKTETPNPTLPGTIHEAADELRGLGAEVLANVGDIRDEERVAVAVARTVETFGGIDLCINNASALNLADVASLPVKRFDLPQSVNVRGTFVVTQACLPHLRKSDHAHVLTLSPPLNLDPSWFAPAAYTVSKYGMTIVTLGVAQTEQENGIAGNCLWPLTAIATAAVKNLLGGTQTIDQSRTPEVVADAAGIVLRRAPRRLHRPCRDRRGRTRGGGHQRPRALQRPAGAGDVRPRLLRRRRPTERADGTRTARRLMSAHDAVAVAEVRRPPRRAADRRAEAGAAADPVFDEVGHHVRPDAGLEGVSRHHRALRQALGAQA
jgi:citronellol/citronellal dehydrogenase